MEIGSIVGHLKDKSILVTGSTGFLAKIFVEKVLRVQPSLKKLFLIVRDKNGSSADQRVQNEVMGKALFDSLRTMHGSNFDSFISKKVLCIVGDIADENLGIKDDKIRELLWRETDIVVNVAATTNFYERYDVALSINVMGAKNVLEFTKKCCQCKMLLHISTAYISGVKEGIITEKPIQYNEASKPGLNLDIEEELKFLQHRKTQLRADKYTKEDEKEAMKKLGITRARIYGWPNTYAFTKAMGEMLLGHLRGDIPLVILRPTIITSIYKDPLPGWSEGARTIDSFIIGYAKGSITSFLGDPQMPIDFIPGDMVVNAMIVAIVTNSDQNCQHIYHVCSSIRNPVNLPTFIQSMLQYFTTNPRTTSDGKLIKNHGFQLMKNMAEFKRYMFFRYRLPLEIFRLGNRISCLLYTEKFSKLWKKYKIVMCLADIYAPYVFFKGCFDDANLEGLRMKTKGSKEATLFDFDPMHIEWENYFYNIHIPGVLKHMCN